MNIIPEQLKNFGINLIPILRTIVVVLIFLVVFNIILKIIKKALIKKSKTKKQKSNIEIFSKIFSYLVFVLVVIIAILSYAGSWTGVGLSLGLFSAALGWALQRPITGIAAWIMVVIKRPFEIGDRIVIGKVKGDVEDISLTHIYIQEIGGIIGGEENSGRIVMIPNAKLFEEDITNYTSQDDYILDQVTVSITYESDLDKAIELILESAKKEIKEVTKDTKKEPIIRNYFKGSSIDVLVKYFAPAKELQKYSSNITKEIYDRIKKEKDVEIAYPHTEILYRKKK